MADDHLLALLAIRLGFAQRQQIAELLCEEAAESLHQRLVDSQIITKKQAVTLQEITAAMLAAHNGDIGSAIKALDATDLVSTLFQQALAGNEQFQSDFIERHFRREHFH